MKSQINLNLYDGTKVSTALKAWIIFENPNPKKIRNQAFGFLNFVSTFIFIPFHFYLDDICLMNLFFISLAWALIHPFFSDDDLLICRSIDASLKNQIKTTSTLVGCWWNQKHTSFWGRRAPSSIAFILAVRTFQKYFAKMEVIFRRNFSIF